MHLSDRTNTRIAIPSQNDLIDAAPSKIHAVLTEDDIRTANLPGELILRTQMEPAFWHQELAAEDAEMAGMGYTTKETIRELPKADALLEEGMAAANMIRQMGAASITYSGRRTACHDRSGKPVSP